MMLKSTLTFAMLAGTSSFMPVPAREVIRPSTGLRMATFEFMIDMPPIEKGLKAQIQIDPVLDVPSEVVEVRYKLPFGLNAEPQKNYCVVTKDGAGGEKVGDVLRFTSQWTMGLPRGDGILTTAASFSGGVAWQCSLFDVMQAGRWEDVIEALTSNVESRTDEIVLIFERPLE